MDFKDKWRRWFWFGLGLVWDLDRVVGDEGRQEGEERKVEEGLLSGWAGFRWVQFGRRQAEEVAIGRTLA